MAGVKAPGAQVLLSPGGTAEPLRAAVSAFLRQGHAVRCEHRLLSAGKDPRAPGENTALER